MDKFQVEATLCKNGSSCDKGHITGTWSTIYDQSFKIELENGLRFLTNFKYTLKSYANTTTMAQFNQLKTGDYEKFNSECDKTMVGFV
jgi:hypothetical protein